VAFTVAVWNADPAVIGIEDHAAYKHDDEDQDRGREDQNNTVSL
jgi:hypothetical protein